VDVDVEAEAADEAALPETAKEVAVLVAALLPAPRLDAPLPDEPVAPVVPPELADAGWQTP
jgi:hypothetical protein